MPSALTVFRLMAGPMRSGLMSQVGHSRRFWHVRSMSGYGVISEMPVVLFCRLAWAGAIGSVRDELATQPDGQIRTALANSPVKSPQRKYFTSRVGQITSRTPRPAPQRGVAQRHQRGAGCGGRVCALDEWRGRGRRSRVVLTSRRWRQVGGGNSAGDGDKKARSPGRARRKPLKPLRAGMPGDPGGPVVTTLVWFLFFPREAAGAMGTRHSPRPPGGRKLSELGRIAPRGRGRASQTRHPEVRAERASKDERPSRRPSRRPRCGLLRVTVTI
jgi:hypothetical protein